LIKQIEKVKTKLDVKRTNLDEIEKEIKSALKTEVATVIDIKIDPEEDVDPFVAPGTGLKDMITGA